MFNIVPKFGPIIYNNSKKRLIFHKDDFNNKNRAYRRKRQCFKWEIKGFKKQNV